jgi:hypothetical protein
METTSISTTTKTSQSFSGINMFKSKRSELTRTASRDLGSYDGDVCSPLPQDDEVYSILMQLEGGLIGAKENILKYSDNSNISSGRSPGGSYFPFQRKCKKQVDREPSDQSMDPDQFLWSDNKHENSVTMPTK